jgi:hypothetical protein
MITTKLINNKKLKSSSVTLQEKNIERADVHQTFEFGKHTEKKKRITESQYNNNSNNQRDSFER